MFQIRDMTGSIRVRIHIGVCSNFCQDSMSHLHAIRGCFDESIQRLLQGSERFFASCLVSKVHVGAGLRRAVFDQFLVVVVGDLDEGHEARQSVLLGGLALDVQAFPNADAPQHLGDGVT